MTTKSEVLTKFFSIVQDYDQEFRFQTQGSFSSSPEHLLRSSENLSLRYDLILPEGELYGIYGELSDAFGIDHGEFFEFISPTIGDLARFILGKIDIS
jgi:hypothetical protein